MLPVGQDRQRLEQAAKEAAIEGQALVAEIWVAETKTEAQATFDDLIEANASKFEKAGDCLAKDREAWLTFYDFPAEHWKHLRTSSPIDGSFATVRHRTIRTNDRPSNKTA